jgi:hypothetical protein
MKKESILIVIILLLFLLLIGIIIVYINSPILLAPGDNNARVVSQIIPSQMDAGQPYPITITLENIGTKTWSAEENYRLGQESSGSSYFGLNRILLNPGESIAPGQQKTFTFYVSAPQTEGTYIFEAKMVQEAVEWFGEKITLPINVIDNRLKWNEGNKEAEPAIAWLASNSNGKGTWISNRVEGNPPDIGEPCPNGFGWTNAYIMLSKLNNDGTMSRKTGGGINCLGASYNNIIPWGDTPDLHQLYPEGMQNGEVIPAHWGIKKSSGLFTSPVTGRGMEEFHPYPSTIVASEEIIPDGNEHLIQGCYSDPVYINENGGGYACYDTSCDLANCPGANTIINTKYRVYDYCQGDFCYANGEIVNSPINFATRLDSVLRSSYTLVGGPCTGSPILTEEQWYAEGVGFIGFSNDDFNSPAPNAVDFVEVYEQTQCISYFDGLCNENPNNYNSCCPAGFSNCPTQSDMILPTISLTNPLNGTTVNGTINIDSVSNDNIGITKVEFYRNNKLIGTDTSFPYSINIDTNSFQNGDHKITARAYDPTGNYATTPISWISIANIGDDSQFISQNIPTTMTAGQSSQVRITFKNVGFNSWDNNYYLSSQNNNWGLQRVDLANSEIISNSMNKNFVFDIVAPSTEGVYSFSWRMQTGSNLFGEATPLTNITVVAQPQSTTTSGSSGSGGSGGGAGAVMPVSKAQCNDGKDNDNDGLIDYPADLGCTSKNGVSEQGEITPPTTVENGQKDGEELSGMEEDLNFRAVFLTLVLLLSSAIILIGLQIIKIMRFNSRFSQIQPTNVY